MGLFSNFPYTNFHELNLNWIISKIKEIEQQIPEGLIGIAKGGTGANNAADARDNLGIYAVNIKTNSNDPTTVDTRLTQINNELLYLARDLQYIMYKTVTRLGQTAGTATLGACWTAMYAGEILIAPPSEFLPSELPETTSGAVVMVRNGGTSGYLRFYGTRTYEMAFVANYPSGTWKTLLNNTDVIPISQGGTGADNAADALVNLGIDFSGEVLSVAGVGADPTGNVPLKITDLIPTDVTDLGIPSGSNVSAIYTVMADHSAVIVPASQVGDAPNSNGIISIIKDSTNNLAVIEFYGKNTTAGDFRMYLNASNVPDGTWVRVNDPEPYKMVPESSAVDNLSVPAGGLATGEWTFPVQVGYTPLMVYNANLNNASNGGTGSGNCGVLLTRIDNTKAYFRVYNTGNSTAKIKIAARMLYVRS